MGNDVFCHSLKKTNKKVRRKKNTNICETICFSSFILTMMLLYNCYREGEIEADLARYLCFSSLTAILKKTTNCQVQILNKYGAASQSSSTFFIAILCCFINIIKHFYMYTFFLSWFLKFCELLFFVLWCELIYPCVIHFVYSRAVPIVTEWILWNPCYLTVQ